MYSYRYEKRVKYFGQATSSGSSSPTLQRSGIYANKRV